MSVLHRKPSVRPWKRRFFFEKGKMRTVRDTRGAVKFFGASMIPNSYILHPKQRMEQTVSHLHQSADNCRKMHFENDFFFIFFFTRQSRFRVSFGVVGIFCGTKRYSTKLSYLSFSAQHVPP